MPYWRLLLFQILCVLQHILSEHSLFDGRHCCNYFSPSSTDERQYLYGKAEELISENRGRLNDLREINRNNVRYELRNIEPTSLRFSEERRRILLGRGIVEQSRIPDNQQLIRTIRDTERNDKSWIENAKIHPNLLSLTREFHDISKRNTDNVGYISRTRKEQNTATGNRNNIQNKAWSRHDNTRNRISTIELYIPTGRHVIHSHDEPNAYAKNDRERTKDSERYLRGNIRKTISDSVERTARQQYGRRLITENINSHQPIRSGDENNYNGYSRAECSNVRDNVRYFRYVIVDRTSHFPGHERLVTVRNIVRGQDTLKIKGKEQRGIGKENERPSRDNTIDRNFAFIKRDVYHRYIRLITNRVMVRSRDRIQTNNRQEQRDITDKQRDSTKSLFGSLKLDVRKRDFRPNMDRIMFRSLVRINTNSRQARNNTSSNEDVSIERASTSVESDLSQKVARQNSERSIIRNSDRIITKDRKALKTAMYNERESQADIRPLIDRNMVRSRGFVNKNRNFIDNARDLNSNTIETTSHTVDRDAYYGDMMILTDRNMVRNRDRLIANRRQKRSIRVDRGYLRYGITDRNSRTVGRYIHQRDTPPMTDRNTIGNPEKLNFNNRVERGNVRNNGIYSRDATLERLFYSVDHTVRQQNTQVSADRNMLHSRDRVIIIKSQERRIVNDDERDITNTVIRRSSIKMDRNVFQRDIRQMPTRSTVRTFVVLNNDNRNVKYNGESPSGSRLFNREKISTTVDRHERQRVTRLLTERNMVSSFVDRRRERKNLREIGIHSRHATIERIIRNVEHDVRQQDSRPTTHRNIVRSHDRVTMNSRQERRAFRDDERNVRDDTERTAGPEDRDVRQPDSRPVFARNMNRNNLRSDPLETTSARFDRNMRQENNRFRADRNMDRNHERFNNLSGQNRRYTKDERNAAVLKSLRSSERNMAQIDIHDDRLKINIKEESREEVRSGNELRNSIRAERARDRNTYRTIVAGERYIRQQDKRSTIDRELARGRNIQTRTSFTGKDARVTIMQTIGNLNNDLNRVLRPVEKSQNYQRLQNNILYYASGVAPKEVHMRKAYNLKLNMKTDLTGHSIEILNSVSALSGKIEFGINYWQYLLYALQGIYIYGIFIQMLRDDKNVKKRSSASTLNNLSTHYLIKVD